EEAGYDFWAAVKAAQQNKYDDAVKALERAREVHNRMRVARFRKAQNPISDPNELIFLTACDELKVAWQVRDKLVKAGLLDPRERLDPAKLVAAVDNLQSEQKGMAGVRKKLMDEKYDGTDLAKAIDQLLADKKTAADEKKKAETAVADTLAALKAAGAKEADDPAKAVKELENAKKAAETKITETLTELKSAGVTDADPVKAVKD